MKHILFAAVAVLFASCGGRGHNHSHDHGGGAGHGHSHETAANAHEGHSHDHSNCDHDHDHGHHHAPGEAHDHTGHDHTTHDHSGCGHDHGPAAFSGEHPEDPDDIIFTREQAARAGVEVSTVEPGPFREVIRVSGSVSPAQGEQVSIVAPAAGIVSFPGRPLTEGSTVASGATLFSVSSANISGGDEIALTRSSYQKARADYERAVRLREDNIVSQAELDAIEAEYRSAEAAYSSLTDAGSGRGAAVKAPVGGYIYGIAVNQGDYVETGQLLATVVRDRNMELRAEVPQRYWASLAGVTSANFEIPGTNEVFNVAELGGSLVSVGKGVQPGVPFIPVVFRFGYRPGILAGSFAGVNLLGTERHGVISVPVEAISEQQGLHYVYVRTGGDVYRRREVRLGGDDGRKVEIVSGIDSGEEVVVRGTVNVRMASASAAIPHSHEH